MLISIYDEQFGDLAGIFSSIYDCLDYYAKELDTTMDKIEISAIECNKKELQQVLNDLHTNPMFYSKRIYSLEHGVDTYVDSIIQIDIDKYPGGKPQAIKEVLRHNPHIIVLENQGALE